MINLEVRQVYVHLSNEWSVVNNGFVHTAVPSCTADSSVARCHRGVHGRGVLQKDDYAQ